MNRIVKYDILRVVACFAIVMLHVSNGYWYVVNVDSGDFTVMTIYNSFTRFGVPVFFMLSGIFLLDPARELPPRKWGSKMLKLSAGFYSWSLFYAFQSVIFNGLVHGWGSVTQEMWSTAFTRFIMGHGHMWFLLDLFGFYLLLPILRKICENIKIVEYFLLLWLITRFFVIAIMPYVGGEIVIALMNSLHLYSLTGYIGYFMGGYYLNKINIPRYIRYPLYAFGIGSLPFTMIKTLSCCRAESSYNDMWFSPSSINILILSTATFILMKNMKIPDRLAGAKWIPAMAKCTFFVYMSHPFFIEKLNLLGINVIKYPVVLSIPVMTIGIFSVTMLLGLLIGKIPIIGKYITFQ